MTAEDHDLLTKHSVKLDAICASQNRTEKNVLEFIEKIDKRCDKRKDDVQIMHDKTMKSTTFWKLVTILIVILTAMVATMGLNRTISLRNEIQIEHNTELIKKNGNLLNEILNDVLKK